MKINILDAAFLPYGNKRLHGRDHPKHFQWTEGENPDGTVLVTDSYIKRDVRAKKLVAWLLEPPGFRQSNYDYVLAHPDKFDYILTYVQYMHDALPDKCLYYSMGYTMLTPEQHNKRTNKTKLVSFIVSPKQAATGHILRHEILKALPDWVDVYGLDGHTPKWDCLKDYAYSICVMGEKYNWCIDEKVIDCFLARTVPIFWGFPGITKRYQSDGIIRFDTIKELLHILEHLKDAGMRNYDHAQNSIEINHAIALSDSKCADEEYIWRFHKDKLL